MSESLTASDRMLEQKMNPSAVDGIAVCVLPHRDVQRFLIDLIDQTNFKGSMLEFVLFVKQTISAAQINDADR